MNYYKLKEDYQYGDIVLKNGSIFFKNEDNEYELVLNSGLFQFIHTGMIFIRLDNKYLEKFN